MDRNKYYIEELQKRFHQLSPSLDLILKVSEKGKREGYHLNYRTGQITLQAENGLGAAYGLNCLLTASHSGHLAESFGRNDPRFSLRPIWFTDYSVSYLNDSKMEKICQRLIEWGYNAIILSLNKDDGSSNHLEIIHQYGLKLIVTAPLADSETAFLLEEPFCKQLRQKLEAIQKKVKNLDYFFWKGTFLNPEIRQKSSQKGLLQRDFAREEAQLVENCLKGCSLIYSIPFDRENNQESWLPDFFDDVGKNTVIAFPAVAGEETMNHQPPHPLWQQLRYSPDISNTRLLPIINGGLIGQGEGRWPVLPIDLIEQSLKRCYRHCFAGALVLCKCAPQRGSWLDACLWIAGQSLWSKTPPDLLAETWFAAYRPEVNYPENASFIQETTSLVRHLCLLRSNEMGSEEAKTLAENLFATLKVLNFSIRHEKKHDKSSRPKLHDYFALLEKEVKKSAAPFVNQNRHLQALESNQVTNNESIEQLINEEIKEIF